MISRPVFVFLLILNIGAALWWALHTPVPAAPEKEAAIPALALANAPANVATSQAAANASPTAALAAAAAVPATNAAQCVMLGAFSDAGSTQRALESLRGAQHTAQAITRLKSPRGFNVLVPPLPTPEAATEMQSRLTTAGFKDQFRIRDGANANGIALGRFGTETQARTLIAKLAAAGFQVQMQPAGPTSSELWVEVASPTGASAEALRTLAGARQALEAPCSR